ncbi:MULTISPECIES: 50S ribosomal protein L29 [unclassified Arthrobacter]|uniref:50S ribosomal protein L29 n=1 Tax=unclassified Arthrobacter TaxID=235627 RepID=UPI002ABA94CA|nr:MULTISPECIES: 50S ribosomal protein L29 [unclassified Arthrobacter]MDZ4092232.1 50S ribosomal protein L29 [Arthrobacter sp.]MDZ4352950.1 50S ribosomal protein L29 [Arthrobacter sp.]MEC5190130.1 large subunit ribosomal protein L29 [Arthrobacter sp. MP_M4]MEC5201598.1 large subunit ribosomal protein L29 [Arthrobacter sp. MP_M7]
MSVGSKELASAQLDGFDNERLVEELRKAKEELFNLRFQSATGQLENHGRLRAVKKDIARIYTVLRERELGIRAEVAAPVVEAKEEKKSKKAATKKADKAEKVETEEDAK